LIEELLGEHGIICIEDIIESFIKCQKVASHFTEIKEVIWPIQVAPVKETTDNANIKHDANGSTIQKKNTKVIKGGYLGNLEEKINEFVAPLI
jgi:hypothetical protein